MTGNRKELKEEEEEEKVEEEEKEPLLAQLPPYRSIEKPLSSFPPLPFPSLPNFRETRKGGK